MPPTGRHIWRGVESSVGIGTHQCTGTSDSNSAGFGNSEFVNIK